MKKRSVIFSLLLFLFAFMSFTAFAGNPIPGVDVMAKKKPGNSPIMARTDKNGKCSLKLAKGEYEVTVSYSQIERLLSSDKSYSSSDEIVMTLNSGKYLKINGNRFPLRMVISKQTGDVKLMVECISESAEDTSILEAMFVVNKSVKVNDKNMSGGSKK